MDKRDAIRDKALTHLQQSEVLMIDGHFDFGNGYHGRVYLNPHQLFRHPSTIWRFAQDLLDLLPAELLQQTEVVAGPVTGGALLAHTDRRPPRQPPQPNACAEPVRAFQLRCVGRPRPARVLQARDRRQARPPCRRCPEHGRDVAKCNALVNDAGGRVLATVAIYDRMAAVVDLGVPHFALADYKAPETVRAADCVLCQAESDHPVQGSDLEQSRAVSTTVLTKTRNRRSRPS